jgi:hypothetical protein
MLIALRTDWKKHDQSAKITLKKMSGKETSQL